MAFHPFRWFRKHQKGFFAFMLIVCMITFVFSFGAAGPIERILYWIGAGRDKGDEVITLYGKKIHTSDLDRMRWQRQMANDFLLFGVASIRTQIDEFIFRQFQVLPGSSSISIAIEDIRKKYDKPRQGESEVIALKEALSIWGERFRGSPRTPEERFQATLSRLQRVVQLAGTPGLQKDAEQLHALDTIATGLAVEAWIQNPQRNAKEYFLGGTNKIDDLLDFAIWKQQADKLGIVLTPADVSREVNRLWGRDQLQPDANFETSTPVHLYLTTSNKVHKSLGARDLLSALTDEFRVALAKEAILGEGSGYRFYRSQFDGIHHSPSVATPDEFLKYFQEKRTTLAVSLLPVAVESFVSKVERKPTEEDLRNLYAAYENHEPSPSQREPGFKEPRRIKVQYFSYSPDSPSYKKLAARVTELLPLFRVGGPASAFSAGGGVAWAASLVIPADIETAIRAQYDEYVQEEARRALHYDRDDASFDRFGQGFDLNNRGGARVQGAAATVGQLAGVAGTGGTPLCGPISLLAANELYERATLSAFASTVLAGASSSPLVALTLPTRYLHSRRPLETVKSQMRERVEKNLARSMAEAAFNPREGTVIKEMQKLRDKPGLQAYIDKVVKDYGLQNYHSMASAQTRQEMLDKPDPALKVLQDAFKEAQKQQNPFGMPPRPDFVTTIFGDTQFFPQGPPLTLFNKEETFVFWRAEDKKAHTLRFDVVRGDVEKAWYLEQARKLARDEARRISSELQKRHDNPTDAVRFLREQKLGDVFELTNVAQMVPKSSEFIVGRKLSPIDFRPYEVPKDRITYPPPDFVDQLLKLKEPGDSLVLADQPVKHYYVAVLMVKPQLPEKRDFYEIYSFPAAGNPLWTDMMNTRRRAYYQELMKQLRAEATKSLEEGEYVIPDAIRTRGESSSGDSGE